MNPQHSAADRTGDDLPAVEAGLQSVAKRIDRTLRRHYATHGMRRLLARPRYARDHGRQLSMITPSAWLVLSTVLLVAAAIGTAYLPQLRAWLPFLPAESPMPHISPWMVAVAIVALLILERQILPRLALMRYRFRLMRLEHTEGDIGFPYVYMVARTADTPTGFGWEAWRGARGIAPGDIVISISDAHGRGRGIIPLRTVGRLPAIVWDRDLLQNDAFPPLPQDVRALALAFDEACHRNAKHANRIERSRALRSGQGQPKPAVDPATAWANVALDMKIKAQLISLASHFASGSASATRGLLLYGPPGTGKTLIARTFADSMGCAFFPLSLTDLKSGYIGQSGENVKAL